MTTKTKPKTLTTREEINLSSEIFPTYKSQSTGSDNYTRLSPFVRDLIGTSGVIHMAEELVAHWFTDIVASYMTAIKRINARDPEQSFFVARISLLEDSKALFTLDDGNEAEVLIKQEIPYTDLKMNLKTYLQFDGQYWFLMMPSEY